MVDRLVVLFLPMDAVGHVNACVGLAQVLVDSGHRVLFAVKSGWKGRLTKYGIEELILLEDTELEKSDKPAMFLTQTLFNVGAIGPGSPLCKAKSLIQAWERNFVDENRRLDPILDELIAKVAPDLLMVDQNVALSAVDRSGLPWVYVCSCNPLRVIENENIPPFSSGEFPCFLVTGH